MTVTPSQPRELEYSMTLMKIDCTHCFVMYDSDHRYYVVVIIAHAW